MLRHFRLGKYLYKEIKKERYDRIIVKKSVLMALNPIALRTAKTLQSAIHSECSTVLDILNAIGLSVIINIGRKLSQNFCEQVAYDGPKVLLYKQNKETIVDLL